MGQSPVHDVVIGVRVFNAQGSSHGRGSISNSIKSQGQTPLRKSITVPMVIVVSALGRAFSDKPLCRPDPFD